MRGTLPSSANELWAMLQEEWECIPQEVIDKLYDSLPLRLAEVVEAKGGNTRY